MAIHVQNSKRIHGPCKFYNFNFPSISSHTLTLYRPIHVNTSGFFKKKSEKDNRYIHSIVLLFSLACAKDLYLEKTVVIGD